MSRDIGLPARVVSTRRAAPLGLGDMAMVATLVAIVGLFLVSPITLEGHGIAYLTSGGGILSKFHPSTLIACVALALRCAASRHPSRTAWHLLTGDPGVVLLLGAVAVAGFCAVFIGRTPVTPLVDSFVLPAIVFVLLRDLDPVVMRWLAILVGGVMCLNAIVALVEFHGAWHLLTIDVPAGATSDPTRGDATFDWRAQLALDWRSTALLGHPLVNGLMVGAFVVCLAAAGSDWIPTWIRLPTVTLQFMSMFAFGARTALSLCVVFSLWLLFSRAFEAVARGARLEPRRLAIACLVIAAVIGAATVVVQTGFVDRTIDRFNDDAGSAATRITMFKLFEPLSWSDMLLGPNADVVATWQRMEGLEFGIESSWLGLALIYGLIVTTMLVVGLGALAWSVIRSSGRGAFLVLLLYFILVSVSASLSGKTTTYAMVIGLIMIFLQGDERGAGPGSARQNGSMRWR